MPKTKSQKILFSLLMSFFMVYGMEVYNEAIINKGMTNSLFLLSVLKILPLMLTVIVLETFIGGPLARKLAFRLINPENSRPFALILTVQVMTVCLMCPMMSLVAAVVFKGGFCSQLPAKWVQTVAINFPMAFCWQIFVAGPIVRLIVRGFSKSLKI